MLLLEPCSPRRLSVCCWPGGSSHKYVSLHRDFPARWLYANLKAEKVPTLTRAHECALTCMRRVRPDRDRSHNRRSSTLETRTYTRM